MDAGFLIYFVDILFILFIIGATYWFKALEKKLEIHKGFDEQKFTAIMQLISKHTEGLTAFGTGALKQNERIDDLETRLSECENDIGTVIQK